LKFNWTSSKLFKPELKPIQIIGGEKSLFLKLLNPNSVAFSPTGELAICDIKQKSVIILSKYFSIIKRVFLGFSTSRIIHKPSTFDHIKNLPSKAEKNSLFMPNTSKNMQKDSVHVDHQIVNVAFSFDGYLAIGYKCGGINISSYKSYDMGDLECMQTIDFIRVLTFLEYSEFESLRNTCWFLHNLTRRYRNKWEIKPMRSGMGPFVTYSFIKWAIFDSGISLKNMDRVLGFKYFVCVCVCVSFVLFCFVLFVCCLHFYKCC
jgi:hypothetical protein